MIIAIGLAKDSASPQIRQPNPSRADRGLAASPEAWWQENGITCQELTAGRHHLAVTPETAKTL
jgi:hypothetical protein